MGIARLTGVSAAVSTAVLLGAASPAHAAKAPECDGQIWSRPGADRVHEISCRYADRVRVARPPEHGTATGQDYDGFAFRVRVVTADDAPETDRLELGLEGPDGPVTQTVDIRNVPLEENSAPVCDPITKAQRSDGLERPEIEVQAQCRDDDHDPMVHHGAGPGRFLNTPLAWAGPRRAYWLRYRTAVHTGPEQAAYWAVDDQGARSADAPISLQVGPLVNRLPRCHENGFGGMRAGVTRRLGVYCQDEDGDDIGASLVLPPLRGQISRFDVSAQQDGWWGAERFIDVTYVPSDADPGEDRFGVLPTGSRGLGAVAAISLPRIPASRNSAGGCGWSPTPAQAGAPVTAHAWCDDLEGDPLTATVVEPPQNGTAGAPSVEVGAYGRSRVSVPYTSEPGFRGTDALRLRVEDEQGAGQDFEMEFPVSGTAPWGPMQYTPGADPAGWFWHPTAGGSRPRGDERPAVGQAPAVNPEAQARRALRTSSVRIVRRMGGALVFAPRAPLRQDRRVRALAVTCAVRCRAEGVGRIPGRGRLPRSRDSAAPSRAGLLRLSLSAAQRRAIKRYGTARATLDLRVRPVTGRARSGRVALRLRR